MGLDKSDWFKIFHFVAPIVVSLVPGLTPFAPIILKGMEAAENEWGNGQGEQKKVEVLSQIRRAAVLSKIPNASTVETAASHTIDQIITTTNQIADTQLRVQNILSTSTS